VDCLPYGSEQTSLTIFQGSKNLSHQTCFFPFRGSHRVRFLFQKAFQIFSRCLFIAVGYVHPSALSTRALELEAMLKKLDADVYVGYNIDTLMTIHRVGSKKNAFTIFDCQEFYSDMGDAQSPLDRKIISAIERRYLPMCDLVLAASDEMADELAREYKIRRPLPLYNVPPVETNAAQKNETGFSLYWRNTTLDLGHRGLGDAIAALKLLPEDITFHIQGNLPTDGGKRLFDTIEKNDLSSRVIVHPPYVPHKAVSAASAYTLGLCLEQATSRNHLLTVSNKMFDYFMAGLPVIASDLAVFREVGGDAADYSPVANVGAWSEKVIVLLEERLKNPDRSLARRARGIERAGQFSWKEYARRMVEVYQQVLSMS